MTPCQRTPMAAMARHMRLALALTAMMAMASALPARAEPLDAIIADYEAFAARSSPARIARSHGTAPRDWEDVSPQAVARQAEEAQALLSRLEASEGGEAIDIAILGHILKERLIAASHDTARIPFTGDSGFHSTPVFTAAHLRISSVDDSEAWIARLNALPAHFDQHIANMRRGIETGWTAHGDPLATTIDQIREQVGDTPQGSDLYAPFTRLPDRISPPERDRLQREGADAVSIAMQAYRDLLAFMETEYAPHARTMPGLASLPGGRRVYGDLLAHHTAGAGYSPEQVHALGLSEVERIRGEMEAIIDEVGFDDGFTAFTQFLRNDSRFYARTPQDLIEKAAVLSKRLDAILPRYFDRLPRLPYGLSPVPASIAPGYTTGRYAQGDPEAGRAGTYLVNTYRLDQRPLYELPALTAHEAVPGHHLQISLAQEMRGQPRFRGDYYATAFGEGWALYAEKLAGEAGIYETPYERFGALSYEMWRACRLVADTGLHWYGWSRAQAEMCFIENTALSAHNIKTEVTRYIGWPGQASAYKIGELKILALREEAETALGEEFDIRDFHDHLLAEGSMPLSVLTARMRAWIEARQADAPATPADIPAGP